MASASYSDIKINIKTSADSNGIKDATKALKEYSAAVSEASNKSEGLSKTSSVLERTTSSAVAQATEKTLPRSTSSVVTESVAESGRNDVVERFNVWGVELERMADGARNATSAVRGFLSAIGTRAGSEVSKFGRHLGSIAETFKRIAFYRFVRTVIKEITEGFKEGVNNLYQWSKLANGAFAQSMDRIATSTLYMKNSLGAMVAPIINALAPAIDWLIDKFVALLNVINQVFALLNGATSWTKAKKYPTEYAKAVAGGAGKAKEALDKLGLAQIDQLTILRNSNGSGSGGGGGGSGLDYSGMFEEVSDFNKRLQDLIGKMKINFNDVLFKWDNLTPEDIAKKAIAGLSAFLGGAAGFIIGGVPGAVVGTLIGGTMGLLIDSIIFDNDGQLSRNEVGEMLRVALFALAGGAIGFTLGGPGGALIGASIGISLYGAIKAFEFLTGTKTNLIEKLMPILGTLGGAAMGFKIGGMIGSVGGPAGALVGAMIGLSLAMAIETFGFSDTSNWKTSDWIKAIVACLAPAAGAIIGLTVGGPGGAAIGALIGLGVAFSLKTNIVEGAEKYGQRLNETVKHHSQRAEQTLQQSGVNMTTTTKKSFDDMESAVGTSLSGTSRIVNARTGDISKEISKQWNNIDRDTSNIWGRIVNTIGSWIEKAKQKLNFSWKLPEVKLPHIPTPHFSMATGIMGVQYPRFDGWWAEGGFPTTGSLFIANEAGPEMVGTMNGRTAVANNDQIVAGISQGVYEAVRDAMGEGNQAVNVYLDGKQISGSVVKNINSETRRTGSSPLLSY